MTRDTTALLDFVKSWYDTSREKPDTVGYEFNAFGAGALRLIEAREGFVEFVLTVQPRHTNSHGTLHGGCLASLVDVVGSAAIMTRGPLRHVSTDINVSYLQASNVGDVVVVRGTCARAGGRLAFSEVTVLREARAGEVLHEEPIGSSSGGGGGGGGDGGSNSSSSSSNSGGGSADAGREGPSPSRRRLTCVARGSHTKYILKTPLPTSRL